MTALTDSSGSTVESYTYDAYGKPSTASSIGNPYMFTGREYDLETGLYYYRARHYSPMLGRFLQRDPWGHLFLATNLYLYCYNNPLIWIDPWGLKPGDPYPTEDAAGKDAVNDINPKSISEGREYGGWVYENPNGTYSYTKPYPGSKAGTSLGPRPSGGRVVGDYHTHGANDPGYNNENFSLQDIADNRRSGTTGYLGTPSGAVKKYEPSSNQQTDIQPSGEKRKDKKK
ncbi:MAG: DUF4329 domain-containing protein [Candidatus Omnitrophica bacterium]|nr:DUF4329 domain-containing protein [Candidatus Omnitrophota bacterium]